MSTLMTSKRFRSAPRDMVRQVNTPEATNTWGPISHSWFVETIEQEILGKNWSIRDRDYRLSREGDELFGMFHLEPTTPNGTWGMSVGFRNAHNKRTSAGVCLGSNVLVCDNLSFLADHVLTRKHHRNSYPVLRDGIRDIIGQLNGHEKRQSSFISKMQQAQISNQHYVHDVLVRLADNGAIKSNEILKALGQWRKPAMQNPEAEYPSVWGLYNAVTWVNKEAFALNPATAAQRSILLNNLFKDLV